MFSPPDRPKTDGAEAAPLSGPVLVGLPIVNRRRRHFVKGGVRTAVVVEVEIIREAGVGLAQAAPLLEEDAFVSDAAPESLDEDVVHEAAPSVPRGLDAVPERPADEGRGSELRTLVGVEAEWLGPRPGPLRGPPGRRIPPASWSAAGNEA